MTPPFALWRNEFASMAVARYYQLPEEFMLRGA